MDHLHSHPDPVFVRLHVQTVPLPESREPSGTQVRVGEPLFGTKGGTVTVAYGWWVLCLPKVHFAGPLELQFTWEDEYDLVVHCLWDPSKDPGVPGESSPRPRIFGKDRDGIKG